LSSRSIRLGATFIAATVFAALVPSVASAAAPDQYGWGVVRLPSNGTYKLAAKDRGSNPAGDVLVKRQKKGKHHVRFTGLDIDGGNVQVTPLSNHGDLCVVSGWSMAAPVLDVVVRCFGRLGGAKDVKFAVSVIEAFNADSGPLMAYAWADRELDADYVPDSGYQHNTSGGLISIRRSFKGRYFVRVPKVDLDTGNVQVTAYGDDPEYCRIASWTEDTDDHLGQVICRKRNGDIVDTRFSYVFTHDEGLKGAWGKSYAYLVAEQPKKGNYVPKFRYRGADPGGKPRIQRVGKGRYIVKLPSMPLGGAAHVTAMGVGKARCNVSGIRKFGKPQRIGVRCFNGTGTSAVDAKFSFSYVK
jgi:hypothetical protein